MPTYSGASCQMRRADYQVDGRALFICSSCLDAVGWTKGVSPAPASAPDGTEES